MGEIRPKTCEGGELTKNQLEAVVRRRAAETHEAIASLRKEIYS